MSSKLFFKRRLPRKCNGYQFDHTVRQRRTASRRCEEATDVFRERYKVRGGIEGTHSGVKRRTGMGHLRVRGGPRVFHAIYLKVAGWNILRSSVCAKMREIVYQRANMAIRRYHRLFSHGWPKYIYKGSSSFFLICVHRRNLRINTLFSLLGVRKQMKIVALRS